MKYFLFCGQEANFQTRSILIPLDEFVSSSEKRKQDFNLLTQRARKGVVFTFPEKNTTYIVDNVIYEAEDDPTDPVNRIVHDLMYYCLEDGLLLPTDALWLKNAKFYVASSGFNHVKNYCNYLKDNPHVETGFLYLETTDGKWKAPPFETVDELMKIYLTDQT